MLSVSSSAKRYLRHDFRSVPGMSSRFSALVASAIMSIQRNAGWRGGVAEIGAFEGRFSVALALNLSAGERAVAVDLFEWPDAAVEYRFKRRLRYYNIESLFTTFKTDSREIGPAEILGEMADRDKIRFFHIDGDHDSDSLWSDMRLAFACMEAWGVVCLDDMLSPAYPELASAALDFLGKMENWTVFCVVDRENIFASAKFLVCRSEYVQFYSRALALLFQRNVWRMGAKFSSHRALVLSPKPLLFRFNPGGTMSRLRYRAFLD